MNPFKKIAITFEANLDSFLRQIENHEAIAESTLREVEQAASRARVQARRIQSEHTRLEKKIQELTQQRALWIERAKKTHLTSEEDALECVRRLKLVESELERSLRQKSEQADLLLQLNSQLRTIEDRLSELRQKKNALASRQAQAEAIQAMDRAGNCGATQVDGVFDRWEASIEGSLPFGHDSETRTQDVFESKLLREEQKEELKSKLAEILKPSENKS